MKKLILFLPFILLLNCNQPGQEKSATGPDASELLKIDKEFSEYSINNGMKAAFLKYAGDDAVMLRPNGYPIEGIEGIRKTLASRNDSTFTLSWEPVKAFIAESSKLGYTYGIYKRTTKENTGHGTYITIWKKYNGEWKFNLDAGNEGLGE